MTANECHKCYNAALFYSHALHSYELKLSNNNFYCYTVRRKKYLVKCGHVLEQLRLKKKLYSIIIVHLSFFINKLKRLSNVEILGEIKIWRHKSKTGTSASARYVTDSGTTLPPRDLEL